MGLVRKPRPQQCLPLQDKLLDYLFRWRKASKCKKVIRNALCRLKLLKNKTSAMVEHLREVIAELLRLGRDQEAFDRVEQLYAEENLKEIYELVEIYCELVLLNLSCIRTQRDYCPADANEAISSLIYASARLGGVPELRILRKLFRKRYGHQFEATAVELLPGNDVNHQLQEMLCNKSAPESAKIRLLDDIIGHCFFQPHDLLPIKYNISSPLHPTSPPQLPLKLEHHKPNYEIQVTQPITVEASNLNRGGRRSILQVDSIQSYITTTPDKKISQKKPNLCSNYYTALPPTYGTPRMSFNDEKKSSSSSCFFSHTASSPGSPDTVIIYDVEEYRSPMKEGFYSQDQRVFVFKPTAFQDEFVTMQRYETLAMDRETCFNYKIGGKFANSKSSPLRNQKSHNTNHHQKNNHLRETERSCSVGGQSYNCITTDHQLAIMACQESEDELMEEEEESDFFDEKESQIWYSMNSTFGYSQNEETNLGSTITSQIRAATEVNGEDEISNSLLGFPSSPVNPNNRRQSSSNRHVHPKLPDYDEIVTKFMALKKAHQQNKTTLK